MSAGQLDAQIVLQRPQAWLRSEVGWEALDTLPVYISIASVAVLLLHAAIALGTSVFVKRANADTSPIPPAQPGLFAHKIARVFGCFTFLGLNIVTLRVVGQNGDIRHQYVDLVTSVYACSLAIGSVTISLRLASIASRHLDSVLLSSAVVYLFRDLIPVAQVVGTPVDASEGWIMWAKIAAVYYIGVAAPLLTPRQYVPTDPMNPSEKPHPEQTASPMSFVLYFWMDSVVKAAQDVGHLSVELMHPLADYDAALHLRTRAFKFLDVFSGARKRHMFFGVMRLYRSEFAAIGLVGFLEVAAGFMTPIGINRLLHYLETRDDATETYRPWVWILWIFVGPIVRVTRIAVRTESIFTQLVFEHALRIRMTAYATSTDASSHDAEADSETPAEDADTDDESAQNFTGKLNNLVTSDLSNVTECRELVWVCLHMPLTLILCIVFLYAILGWSAFIGLALILVTIPAPGLLTKLKHDAKSKAMKKTDARVEIVSEVLNALRMVKLFGWERKMGGRISKAREEELVLTQRMQYFNLGDQLIQFLVPMVVMIGTFAAHVCPPTLLMKQELNASKVFSSMVIFEMFSQQMGFLLWYITCLISGKVSLDRFTDFFHQTELLDSYADSTATTPTTTVVDVDIGFKNATLTWSEAQATTGTRNFVLQIDDKLEFKRGHINLVIGPTGSGKTSLLLALLGEMHFCPGKHDACYNLPREGGVSHAAQESWVLNDTIKNNIVFGSEFDESRYSEVIRQCALRHDLSLFEAGDQTEVGEKGITLSGGQKARITLARAIYSSAEVILLDDVLAALDFHTSKWIVTECLEGPLVKGRTVILVTHNIAISKPIAEFVVLLKDGTVESQGSLATALTHDVPEVQEEAEVEVDEVSATDTTELDKGDDNTESDGKLIDAEEIKEGHVGWSSMKLYLKALSGNRPAVYFMAFLTTFLMQQVFFAVQTWYLGYWSSEYERVNDPTKVSIAKNIGIYALILLAAFIFLSIATVIHTFGAIRASRNINQRLIDTVLGTTLRWLDITPISRIITRCTEDIGAIDMSIPHTFLDLTQMTLEMIVKFAAVLILTPIFILPGLVVLALGYVLGQLYLKAQLSVKREQSAAKAPVLAHFSASVAGLVSIRAYGVQERFIEQSRSRINNYTCIARSLYNLNHWVDVRINFLATAFSAGLAAYLVYMKDSTASDAGFSLNMAVGFSTMILYWVRVVNDFEVECKAGNSLERIQSYLEIEQEDKPTNKGVPPAYWPSSDAITVEKLAARYSPTGPKVLKVISFTIKTGERIGIVGRTGSGKSSLTLALLRCIYTEGSVYFDGIDTTSLNLDELRSRITIIPQPELLSASVRENLDPFGQYDDAMLNDAMRSAGLTALQAEMGERSITLESMITSGGGNLSVGQRQILALARALVRGSKLLILDEATSAIDYKTDGIIQTSLRTELKPDTTLITVAHRLQTVMDADKIMVLDAGNIVDFDSPENLLAMKNGKLRALVDESEDKDTLAEIVYRSR